MTIALGLLGPDGVVIAADTQQSFGYAGGAKVTMDKIHSQVLKAEHRGISITGAGDVSYLEALSQRVADAFVAERSPSDVEERLQRAVSDFWAAHMDPFSTLPIKERPTVQLIIGVTWNSRSMLYATDRNVVRRCEYYAAVGAGSQYALGMLSQLAPGKPESSVDLTALMAAYVIFQVKEYVDGCGKGTQIAVLQHGSGRHMTENTIGSLESAFRDYVGLGREVAHSRTRWSAV